MSAPHRPFLLRFTLVLLGMLLLIAVVFAGLGWMVARHEDLVGMVIGDERAGRTEYWYVGFMANLMPGDTDGDGVCDGAKLFVQTYYGTSKAPSEFGMAICVSHPNIISYCEDRLSTRWLQGVWGASVRWPRGFRAVVRATKPVLLPKGGVGPPTVGPLVVMANERGELEFDIMGERVFDDVDLVNVYLVNAANNTDAGSAAAVFPGWRMEPLPASIHGPPVTAFPHGANWQANEVAKYDMKWVSRAGWKGNYVIEAAPVADDDRWEPVITSSGTGVKDSDWSFGTDLWQYFPGYTGPLKFRVVPVSATPP